MFGRYGAGTLEQIVIALLNFSMVCASGKILPPAPFAIFVVIMASLTLAFALCAAFVSAPVLVVFRKRYDTGSIDYLRKVEWLNMAVCVPISIATVGIGRIFESKITWLDTGCAALALTAWSSYELRRRTAFALGAANRLLPCSILVLISSFVGVGILLVMRQNHESGMLLVLAASYGAGIAMFTLTCKPPPGDTRFSWKKVATEHWTFASSLVASVAFYWAASQGYFMIAARYIGPEALGGARTAQNLAGLISMCVLMFENHSTPEAARIEHRDGKQAVRIYIQAVYRKLSAPFVAFIIVASLAGFAMHHFLYREHYAAYSALVFLFAFHQFLTGAGRPYAVGLKAIECNAPIFWGYFYPAVAMCLFGWLIVWQFQAYGIGIGFCLSALITWAVLRRSFNRLVT